MQLLRLPILLQLSAACAALLAAALISQYGFGLRPCHLCIYQRIPYAIIIALGALAWLCRKQNWQPYRRLLVLAMLLLLVEVGIAGYHSGVERHIFSGPTDCATTMHAGQSIEQLRAQILGAALVRCDEPVWMLPNLLSMANANLIAALFLLGYAWRQRNRF